MSKANLELMVILRYHDNDPRTDSGVEINGNNASNVRSEERISQHLRTNVFYFFLLRKKIYNVL